MKKKLSLFVAAFLLGSLVLTGCGGSKTGDNTATAGSASESTPGEAQGETTKVALLLAGSLGDMSFLDSANAGMKMVAENQNVEVKVIEMGADPSTYETNFLDASEEDYDVIIGSGWQTQEPIEKVAPEFPEKKYIIFDAAVNYEDGKFENVYSITYKQNEGSFLAGYMAGKMSETGTIGFLGGADGVGINDFLVGYIEGAKYANPDIKVLVGYINSFTDSAKCKEMALSQYNQGGADLIFTAAGAAGMGTLDAAKETGNYAIGADSDQAMLFKESDPEKAEHIPASVLKRVDNSLVRAFEMLAEDKIPWGESESLGLEEDAVALSDNEFYERLVSQEIRDEIVTVRQEIIDGTVTVSTAFGKDNAQIAEIVDSVKP